MKNWIKVIFALNNKLDALTYSIDGQVDNLASLTSVPAMDLFDRIIKLNDKKVRIINLRVLHDKMKEALSPSEYAIITASAFGKSFADIAREVGLSKAGVYKAYVRIIEKLTKLLHSFGYDCEKFACEYNDMVLITRTYKKIARMAS